MMRVASKFAKGEKVLCYHGPLVYEAKCLHLRLTAENQYQYFIHYAGWNKGWDEWVTEARVLKYNKAKLVKQKEIEEARSSANSTIKGKKSRAHKIDSSIADSQSNTLIKKSPYPQKRKLSFANSSGHNSGSKSTKKKRARMVSENSNKKETKMIIPDDLKYWLVDDLDIINRQHKLPNLPARLTVDKIINQYLVLRKTSKSIRSQRENFSLLKELFNTMLGIQLLYKFERPQYAQVLQENPDVPMCKIYGAMHLLRMFAKLSTNEAVNVVHHWPFLSVLHNFFNYMIKNNSSMLSLQDYTSALPEYLRQAL